MIAQSSVAHKQTASRNREAVRTFPSRSRTKRLFLTYRRTGDRAVRDEIFTSYESLVHHVAKKYAGRGVDYDDLYQEGCTGLLDAIERFDIERGSQFQTFAPYYIRGAITQYFRNKTWPCSVPKEYREWSLHIRDMAGELGREPTRRDVIERTGLSEKKADAALAAFKVWESVCLHKADATDNINPAALPAISCEDRAIESLPDRLSVQAATSKLPPDEAKVVHLYYGNQLSQREIAQAMGTYQMMVLRLLRRGTKKIGNTLVEQEWLMAS